MHIRWNKNWTNKGDYIYAILAENREVEGKIRPKTIKYLGGLRENHPSPYRRIRFWEKVEKNLSELELPPETMEKIIISLEKRVPKPSDDDLEKEREEVSKKVTKKNQDVFCSEDRMINWCNSNRNIIEALMSSKELFKQTIELICQVGKEDLKESNDRQVENISIFQLDC